MADIIRGTNIADPIVPFTSDDNYPTHLAKFGKGGFRTVETIEERNSIPLERREPGMLVYVITDGSNVHTYQWFPVNGNPNGKWERSKMGGGDSIPIYDAEKKTELGQAAEDDYIFIPSISDGNGEVVGNTYTTAKNGNYVDILFSAIRQLQSEVARLRNAFNYGIYSYSGTTTAMSRTLGVYEEDPEEEPLWAIEEDGLSLVEDIILSDNATDFEDLSGIDLTVDGLPHFTKDVAWLDRQNLVSETNDSKLFLYLTVNGLGIKVGLGNKNDEEQDWTTLNLERILGNISHLSWYNILTVISRTQELHKKDENNEDIVQYYGTNFIWISVSNPKNNITIAEGYLDLDNKTLKKSFIPRDEGDRFTIKSIEFNEGLTLSKAIVYSKYQDFSQEIIPNKPTDETFSYKAAHITIRSVSTFEILNDIKDQLPENELIFVEDTKKLYIKNNHKLVAISGSAGDNNNENPGDDDTMKTEDILQALAEQGIIALDSDGNYTGLQPLSSITLINEDTGKHFEISVDAYGILNVKEINETEKTLADQLEDLPDFPPEDGSKWEGWRGFVGQLRATEDYNDRIIRKLNGDVGLASDRVKIGSFYAPTKTQLTFGCSHGFIELENTGRKDFPLDGCYLHYARKIDDEAEYIGLVKTSHLKLSGKIPAGGTYLIRCKQYADFDDPNTFIKVSTYDIEWYDKDITVLNSSGEVINRTNWKGSGELIDLSHSGTFEIYDSVDQNGNPTKVERLNVDPHGLALTYGKEFSPSESSEKRDFVYNCRVWTEVDQATLDKYDLKADKVGYLYWPKFIDAVYYNQAFVNEFDKKPYWEILPEKGYLRMASCVYGIDSNSISDKDLEFIDAIYKNTFELDPAKQAYQALNTYDSSRYRNANVADYQYVLLNNEFISFPKTEEKFPVSKYTPKASFEGRNVLTDKNKLDPEIPNCVTCSFGINPYTTRTFNWVSSGYFDEYVWVREKKEQETSWNRFSSYIEKAEGTEAIQNSENIFPWRKEFDANINNIIYKRIYGYFPGDKTCTYTSHKCILDIVGQAVNSKTVYEYVVGRSLINGEPDPEHTSEIMTFTLYPENYPLRIYQTTDQQGFHWIEYQVWGAAANYINNQINNDCSSEQIFPILMNTGDMTQSGSRVNEWVDYYNAGYNLFNHLEQVNCVGNNDLCGTVVTELGTGDDIGKSNSFYFHVFYCYEVDTEDGMVPIIRGKYFPSLYHIDFNNFRLVMVNSELTNENCKSWYKLVIDEENQLIDLNMSISDINNNISLHGYKVINAYTGWDASGNNIYYGQDENFTPIYNILYKMLRNDLGDRKCIVACHEMPYTVITQENLAPSEIGEFRSVSGSSLVGSHLNQLTVDDNNSVHWFSRLLEYSNVRLCIGGHKHTYAITWPVREHYYYRDSNGEIQSSYENGSMKMREDLSQDRETVIWFLPSGKSFYDASTSSDAIQVTDSTKKINLTKYPIIEVPSNAIANKVKILKANNTIAPGTIHVDPDSNLGVIYSMCQATGFKLMSNKELPSPQQVFSRYFPKSNISKSTASPEQRRPMYSVIDLFTENIGEEKSYKIQGKVVRLNNIQQAPKKLMNQLVFGTAETKAAYLYDNRTYENITDQENLDNTHAGWTYGSWRKTDTDDTIIDILI